MSKKKTTTPAAEPATDTKETPVAITEEAPKAPQPQIPLQRTADFNVDLFSNLTVGVRTTGGMPLPEYKTPGSAGMDLRASLGGSLLVLQPGERALVKTGVFLEIPELFEAQIRPRSGLAYEHGVTVVNSPGTIDSDYRDEVGVLLINQGQKKYIVKHGDRIAQLVFAQVARVSLERREIFSETQRTGGYGSTGKA